MLAGRPRDPASMSSMNPAILPAGPSVSPSADRKPGPRLRAWVLVSVGLHVIAMAGWHWWPHSGTDAAMAIAPTLAVRLTKPAPAPAAVAEALPETPPETSPEPVAAITPESVPEPAPAPTLTPTPKPQPKPKPVQAKKPPAKPAAQPAPPAVAASPPAPTRSTTPATSPTSPTRTTQSRDQAGAELAQAELAQAELARLLRHAIEDHKRYPFTARRRGQQGTATVGFTLTPDGRIEGLTLDAASGHTALDQAALAAVEGIAPFQPAGRYLDAPAAFRLDIAFRLSQQ